MTRGVVGNECAAGQTVHMMHGTSRRICAMTRVTVVAQGVSGHAGASGGRGWGWWAATSSARGRRQHSLTDSVTLSKANDLNALVSPHPFPT